MFATLAGGYPWPADLPPADALAAVLRAQVDAGIGLLADGRVHAAETPADDLVASWQAARDGAARLAGGLPVKVAVVGPWSAGGPAGCRDAATALNGALRALAAAGCPFVEMHEAAAALPGDEAGRAGFVAAHAALLDGLPGALHTSLAITGGDAVALGVEALVALPYRSHLFDLLDGPDSWRLVAAIPGERGIVAGVGDATGRRRTRLEDVVWAAGYAASTEGRGMGRTGIAPSGGLEALAPDRAAAVIKLLSEAAAVIAAGPDEVVARFDPRAIDARTAALGQYRPRRKRAPGR